MEIRIRETGQVMLESELRQWAKDNNGPSWGVTTPEVLEALGADPVFEGPQASGLEFWQSSLRSGVEQIGGKWYTKYIAGPVFDTQAKQAAYVAQKTAEKTEAFIQSVQDWTQKRLDDFALTRGYNSMLSLCTYATSPHPKFSKEGQYGVEVRDAIWAKLLEMLEEVKAGTRPLPSDYAEIETELPVLEWPI